MKKNFKGFMLFGLIMVTFTTTPVFASSNQNNKPINIDNEIIVNSNFKILVDNEEERVAEETIGEFKYIYKFKKEENILTTMVYDFENNKIKEASTLLVSIKSEDIHSEQLEERIDMDSFLENTYSSHCQTTFSNYEYDKNYFYDEYKLRNKDLYKVLSLSTYKDEIEKYIASVDKLNATEVAIITTGSIATIYAMITYFTQGLTTSEIATATGILLGDIIAYNTAINKCKSIWSLYIE